MNGRIIQVLVMGVGIIVQSCNMSRKEPVRVETPPSVLAEAVDVERQVKIVVEPIGGADRASVYFELTDSTDEATNSLRQVYLNEVARFGTDVENENVDKIRQLGGVTITPDDAMTLSPWISALRVIDWISADNGANLVIKANKEVSFEVINQLFDELKANGLNRFSVMTSLKQ